MKTILKVDVTAEKVEYIPMKQEMKQGVVYISDRFGTAVHACLCGCRSLTVTPLGVNGWRYVFNEQHGLTMTPSIGNFKFDCKSHYIITKGTANFV